MYDQFREALQSNNIDPGKVVEAADGRRIPMLEYFGERFAALDKLTLIPYRDGDSTHKNIIEASLGDCRWAEKHPDWKERSEERGPSHSQTVEPSERAKAAWDMRQHGLNFRQIGCELGVGAERARALCNRYSRYFSAITQGAIPIEGKREVP